MRVVLSLEPPGWIRWSGATHWPTRGSGDRLPFSASFVEQLEDLLRQRRIQQGIAMLDSAVDELKMLGPETPGCGRLLILLARWVDVGFRDYRFLDAPLSRFSAASRRALTLQDYVWLKMVEGFRALASADSDGAIETLETVLRLEADLGEKDVVILAHFWKGRAHRKKGEYELALAHIMKAREMAQARGNRMATAVIQIQESWLLFQKGMVKDALRILAEAESTLRETDHYVALGNIESARGRMVRRMGEYTKALEHFALANRWYEKRDIRHVNLARSLVNAAYVQRLLALEARKRIDRSARSGKAHPAEPSKPGAPNSELLRARYQTLCHEALENLDRARRIYEAHANQDGIGKVTLNLGYLHLDRGDVDRATPEAEEAYRIGCEKGDHILMARARILQAAIENFHVEEQTGEEADITAHAQRALEYSEEALHLARATQNRRLIAGACIARGTTAANDVFQDWDEARKCSGEATTLVGPGERDVLVEDLAALKARIVQASGINDILRGWSEGMVADKTFQQVTEEFAEIVIPKVWIREGRKIARVAERLSISPKKVRRVLRNAGWMDRDL